MPVWLSNAVLARVPLRLANWSLVHALTVVNSCIRGLWMGFSGSSNGSGYTPPAPTYRAPTLVRPRDLPDYKPPVGAGSVRADADGNLWVRTIQMRPSTGGLIYDIINRQGELFDRIQLPAGYQLVGFGQGKLVYLSNRDATGLHLSRVRLK